MWSCGWKASSPAVLVVGLQDEDNNDEKRERDEEGQHVVRALEAVLGAQHERAQEPWAQQSGVTRAALRHALLGGRRCERCAPNRIVTMIAEMMGLTNLQIHTPGC